MNVLLISANRHTEPHPVYPLGLDYVAGAIASDHDVRIADMNQWPDTAALEAAIQEQAPDVVGLSLRNTDNTDLTRPMGFMPDYALLMKAVRRASTSPVVLGGSAFTLFPEEFMAALKADYGIIGEGERLSLLLHALARNNDPSTIEGVIVRGRPAGLPAPWPWETRRRFDPRSPHLAYYLQNSGVLNLQTKRGCPFQCIYCTYPYIEGRNMRCLDPADVARTAVALQAGGARYIFVTDSAFNADPAHSTAVARAFKKAGLTIPWGAFFSPSRCASGDYFQIMADCGLRHAEFGTESLNDTVLAFYAKPFHSRDVFKAHDSARAAGIHIAHYFLFGGPGETPRTLEDTLKKIEDLDKCVLFLFQGMRIFPHTGLYDLALAQGRITKGRNLIEPAFYQSPGIDARTIEERIAHRARGRINWVTGAGGEEIAGIVTRMYQKGYSGPLWEYLCR
jgi:radical SAM superfamily enzyme YgiQ (UPF0313 family)